MKVLDLPMRCIIPTPVYAPRARGMHSTGRFGHNLRVRCSVEDFQLIETEAKRIGIPVAMFVRHCAVFTAEYLRNYHDDRGKEHDNSA